MSVTRLSSSDPNKMYKISSQRNKNSGELDVFEAARYFSATNELQRATGRMSLDSVPPHMHTSNHQKQRNDHNNKSKLKQPSSPGGRLASFLNSLFNQTSSKKKSKPEEENHSAGRRKRRSSISHIRITTLTSTASDHHHQDEVSNSKSGFRTPPPYANTPMKSYKEFRSLSEQSKAAVSSLPRLQNEAKRTDLGSLDEKFKVKNVSDGYDSDSSSDLFDLPNHDLDFYPTGLPVYETTHMDRIKIGSTPVSRCSR